MFSVLVSKGIIAVRLINVQIMRELVENNWWNAYLGVSDGETPLFSKLMSITTSFPACSTTFKYTCLH